MIYAVLEVDYTLAYSTLYLKERCGGATHVYPYIVIMNTTILLIGLIKPYFFYPLLYTFFYTSPLHFFSLLYTFFYIRHPFFFFGFAKEEKIVKLKSLLFGNNVIIYYICHFVTIHKNRYFLAII